MKNLDEIESAQQRPTQEHDFLGELLKKRWSPRSFSDEKIPRETLIEIFDAGRKVMSCFNEQPWRVIFSSKDDPQFQKLFACLGEFNQKWVKMVPYLGVVISKKHFTKSDKENRTRFYDSGAFMAFATLRATSLDIYVHQMAGFSPEKVKETFVLPDEYEPITMFALGKLGNPEKLPEEFLEREKTRSDRKEISEFLFGEKWEVPY